LRPVTPCDTRGCRERGREGTVPDRAARSGPVSPEAPNTGTAGRRTILVAEDDEGVRRLATTILKRHGYDVLEATDGNGVLKVFESAKLHPALVILDQRMPGPGAERTLAALRALDPGVRVLLMSGFTEPELAPEVLRHARGFLAKPFRGGELLRAVEEALGDG
jgi:two-component system cell cycle sensor histidine kinase/response regulator CckA